MSDRKKSPPSKPAPVAAAAKKAATPEGPKGVPYVAIPKELFDQMVAKLMECDYKEVEPILAPIRFGGVAKELTMVPSKG